MKKSVTALATAVFSLALFAGISGSANAAQIPYVEGQPLPSIQNPVFNTYTNIPNGIGNEADFVRIRPSTGNVADNGAGGVRNALYVNGLDAKCSVGDKFDVRTYVHNGADDDFNDNGNGSAVAHGTKVRMTAPLGTENNTFTFTSQVMATDVSPVTDTARLYCEKNVTLKLVPQSVKVVSKHYGFNTVSDSAVNGDLPIGSHVLGSGDVWGCWDERVIVAYIVEVVKAPEAPKPVYTCDLLSVKSLGGNKYRFNVAFTAKNGATFKDVSYDFGDGTKVNDDAEIDHTFAKENNKYKVIATANFMLDGKVVSSTSADCAKEVTVTKENCTIPGKENYPKDSPECRNTPASPPKALPNTGPGSFAGIFAAVTIAGALAHRKFTLRRG